jgi:uncharacterized protein YyaL (SSP411 family)
MTAYTNKLIHESSPYLLQHAHNPVDWYPWGAEALQKAKDDNKPILVSIGYSACHWCHVMEKESFEDEKIARFMNENFINIKIDREERPDLDHIYMDAVQAMTGSGGWPLHVFLTPGAKPFYGGTYFPPRRAYNRPSWYEVLQSVVQAFSEKRHEIDAQAENLTEHLLQANSFGLQTEAESESFFHPKQLDEVFRNLLNQADKEWGGFGRAPKFPQPFSIQYLLRYYYLKGNKEALDQALLSLDKMYHGGIYDHVGGGFARYSTDNKWLVPHFEKMLYDNALLIAVLSEAYQLTGNGKYKEVIDETMEFVHRELLHHEGGFFSALDADSEGEEGKYYVWTYEEVKKLLGNDAGIFCEYFDITEKGNWTENNASETGKNILWIKSPANDFATSKNISAETLQKHIENGKKILLEQRNKRTAPMLDDKIILGWNALMNIACCQAFAATGNELYRQMAVRNMHFLLEKFVTDKPNEFYHTWKNNTAKYPAFLDDYAYLIKALLQLQEITADLQWLLKAREITEFVIEHFSDEQNGFFYFTKSDQPDVIIRKKEVYDGAIPSGNAVMAFNLYQLSRIFHHESWREQARKMVSALGKAVISYPTSFGCWACLLQEIISGTNEIILTGNNFSSLHLELLGHYIPHRIILIAGNPQTLDPIFSQRPHSELNQLWLCRDNACLPPVATVTELISLINRPDQR